MFNMELGGECSILLSYVDMPIFWLKHWVFRQSAVAAVFMCILRAPAVADALTTGRGAVIERSAGGAGQDCL